MKKLLVGVFAFLCCISSVIAQDQSQDKSYDADVLVPAPDEKTVQADLDSISKKKNIQLDQKRLQQKILLKQRLENLKPNEKMEFKKRMSEMRLERKIKREIHKEQKSDRHRERQNENEKRREYQNQLKPSLPTPFIPTHPQFRREKEPLHLQEQRNILLDIHEKEGSIPQRIFP